MASIERSPEEIQALADEIRVNGYVLLDDMIPAEKVDAMREAFDPLLQAKRDADPPNRGVNRFQMHLPFEMPFADPVLYNNSTVMAIVENLFGKDHILTYFASDTPFPGSDYQKIHLDCRLPFPEAGFAMPVYSVVLNTPMVDFTEENGPLEIWPNGTHMIAQPRDIERMAAKMKAVRLLPKTGSILLRDARMWHRGTPSHGARSRPNVALVYSRGWFRFESHSYRMKIPRATYDAFPDALRPMFRYCAILEADGSISDVV